MNKTIINGNSKWTTSALLKNTLLEVNFFKKQ